MANTEKARKYQLSYIAENKEYIAERGRQYRKDHYEHLREWKRLYKRERRANNPVYKLQSNVRRLILLTFEKKKFSKQSKTYQILGCSFDELLNHLKETAVKNYGGWHARIPYQIDHIIPISSAKTEDDVIRLNHYTNLQYLTAEDNAKKGARI
jgi:hypothetical protein